MRASHDNEHATNFRCGMNKYSDCKNCNEDYQDCVAAFSITKAVDCAFMSRI